MAVSLTKIVDGKPALVGELPNQQIVKCPRCDQTCRLGSSDNEWNHLPHLLTLAERAMRESHKSKHTRPPPSPSTGTPSAPAAPAPLSSGRSSQWYPSPWGHPVATKNELRRYPRFNSPKGTILAWQSGSQRFVSPVESVGMGGLFIRTIEPPPLGTFIQLLLDTPQGEIRARAVVQSTRSKRGMGVKIVAMQQEDRARFARWLKSLPS